MNVAVVFHSAMGSAKQLAQAVAAGAAAQPGVDAIQIEIVGADIIEGRFHNNKLLDQLDNADALIFGSPNYMGCMSA